MGAPASAQARSLLEPAHRELHLHPGADRGARSFSTHPRRRMLLDEPRLRELERREARITERLIDFLDLQDCECALLARIGSDLSTLRFDGESPRFTHVAIAVKPHGLRARMDGWCVHHLLNTHEGPQGHLYQQSLVEFFRDDPLEYCAGVMVPSRPLQQRIVAVLGSPLRETLYTCRYNRIAYPFSTRYINSNQWVAEIVGAAQSGADTRDAVQRFLAQRGLRPTALIGMGAARQWVAGLLSRNTRLDDHPRSNRRLGRFEFVMEPSLRAYLCASDPVRAVHVVSLGDHDSRREPTT